MADFPGFSFFTNPSTIPMPLFAPNLNLEQQQLLQHYQFLLQPGFPGFLNLVPDMVQPVKANTTSPMLNALQNTPSPRLLEQNWNSTLSSNLLSSSISTASTSVSPSESSTPSPPRDPRQFSCSPGSQDIYASSRGSPEIDVCGAMKVKRGRPQQDIKDESDPCSQKKRHRRLYARDYRQKMRKQVDQVGPLQEEVARLERIIADQNAEMERVRQESASREALIQSLLGNKA